MTERRFATSLGIPSLGQGKRTGFLGQNVVQINLRSSIDISSPSDMFAIRRKTAACDLPFVAREPGDFLRSNFQKRDVFISIGSIRCDQQRLSIRRKIIGLKQLLALMRSQQSTLARLDLSHKYVGVCSLGLLLRVDN